MLESAHHYRSLFHNMLNGLAYCKVLTDSPPPHDFVYLEVNEAFENLTGLKNVVGKKVSEVIPGIRETDAGLLNLYSTVALTGQPQRFERYVEALQKWFSVSVYSPKIQHFVAVFDVITEQKRVVEALGRSEERFRTLAAFAPVGIFLTDANGNNVFLNPAGEKIVGRTAQDARGSGWSNAVHPDDRERVFQEWVGAAVAGRDFSSEYRFLAPTGKVTWVRGYGSAIRDSAGSINGYVGVFVDITELRALHGKLALAERLAAMGTLVAGIAHEMNNPLAALLADQGLAIEVVKDVMEHLQGDAALDRMSEGRRLASAIEAIGDAQESAHRVAGIVRELSTFGRPDPTRTRARVTELIGGAIRWLPSTVAKTATIQVENSGAPDIVASVGQIEQVITNLITNAAQATPAGGQGVIVIHAGPGQPGMARIEVIDCGSGIQPDMLNRIFDPFVSMRPVGKGMGIGLAVCHAIVTAHGGTLMVESEVGKGSTFRVELPAAPAGE
jgi:PAS domain S-box-containing protein